MSTPHDVAFELHDLVLTMDRQAAALLAPLHLTLRQHTALVIIDQHPGIQGRDLAGGLGITPAGATGVVKTLITAGLVRNCTRPGDGNRQALQLTPEGAHRLAASTNALSNPFNDVVRNAGHNPTQLAHTLRDITNYLRNDTTTNP